MMYTIKKQNHLPLRVLMVGLLLVAALFLAGCNDRLNDEPVALPDGEEVNVSLNLAVPGMKVPVTYAVPSDRQIAEIDVLAFNNSTQAFVARAEGSLVSEGTGDGNRAIITAVLPKVNGCVLVVVANARASVNAAVGTLGASFTKKDLLSLLTVSLGSDPRWPSASGLFKPLPMYGESGAVNITSTLTSSAVSVDLVRMVARIDVKMNDAASELKAIHVYNSKGAGYVSPIWDPATGVVDFASTIPNVPAVPGNVITTPSSYVCTVESGVTGFAGLIFAFESQAMTDVAAERDKLPGLVVSATYGGTPYFYRVDFTDSKGNFIPLLRNHKYIININQVAGRGYATAAEAWASLGETSNLRAKILSCDEGQFGSWAFNGQNMLAIESSLLNAASNGVSAPAYTELAVFTDYEPVGVNTWSAQLIDAGFGTAWAQIVSGYDAGSALNTESVVRLRFDANNIMPREVTLRITAGSLVKDVTIVQLQVLH